jgi:hypothetical protein
MRRLALTIVWFALACSDRNLTQPPTAPAASASSSSLMSCAPSAESSNPESCQKIAGHIAGQIIGPTSTCGGQLTEVGTFTGLGGGSFVACITEQEQEGNGSLRFLLVHTYTTNSGDTFTTSDRVVAAPTGRPAEYLINNQVDITGGTGGLAGASGFIRTHGTVNLQTGVVSVDYHGQICMP